MCSHLVSRKVLLPETSLYVWWKWRAMDVPYRLWALYSDVPSGWTAAVVNSTSLVTRGEDDMPSIWRYWAT
jgi:hypothetical protein